MEKRHVILFSHVVTLLVATTYIVSILQLLLSQLLDLSLFQCFDSLIWNFAEKNFTQQEFNSLSGW